MSLYSQTVLADTPRAYYRCDETSGTSATDSSGNSFTATYGSGVTFSVASALPNDADTSVTFNGTVNGICTLPSITPSTSAFTVECWFNLSTLAYSGHPRIHCNDHTDTTFKGFELYLSGASGVGLTFAVGNGTTSFSAVYSTTLAASTWYHAVGVFTGTSVQLYINGVLAQSTAFTGTMSAGANSIGFGRAIYNTTADFFPGSIDEFAFYNTNLSSTRIQGHYTNAQLATSSSVTDTNPSRSETASYLLTAIRTITETEQALESIFVANAGSIGYVNELNASYLQEQVTFYPGIQSAPTAQMTNFDLDTQYARIENSAIIDRLQFCSHVYYSAAGGQKLLEGELDALFINENISMLHVMKTINDVNAFIAGYDYMSSILEDNPFAYYRLGDGAGGTAADISGNNFTGAVVGGVTTGQPGAIYNDPNTAMKFDGSSGYVTLPATVATGGLYQLTVELWINPTSIQTSNHNPMIANDNPGVSLHGFTFTPSPTNEGGSIYVQTCNGSTVYSLIGSGGTLSINTWYHAAFVYDGIAGTMTLYLNGALVGTKTVSGPIATSSNTIWIANTPAISAHFYSGYLDEVAIYPYAVNPARFAYRYQIAQGLAL